MLAFDSLYSMKMNKKVLLGDAGKMVESEISRSLFHIKKKKKKTTTHERK